MRPYWLTWANERTSESNHSVLLHELSSFQVTVAQLIELLRYQREDGREPFAERLNARRDKVAEARVRVRLRQMEAETDMSKLKGVVSHHEAEVAESRADRELAVEYLKAAMQSLDDPNQRAAGLVSPAHGGGRLWRSRRSGG